MVEKTVLKLDGTSYEPTTHQLSTTKLNNKINTNPIIPINTTINNKYGIQKVIRNRSKKIALASPFVLNTEEEYTYPYISKAIFEQNIRLGRGRPRKNIRPSAS